MAPRRSVTRLRASRTIRGSFALCHHHRSRALQRRHPSASDHSILRAAPQWPRRPAVARTSWRRALSAGAHDARWHLQRCFPWPLARVRRPRLRHAREAHRRGGAGKGARAAVALSARLLAVQDGRLAAGPVLLRGVRKQGDQRRRRQHAGRRQPLPDRLRIDSSLWRCRRRSGRFCWAQARLARVRRLLCDLSTLDQMRHAAAAPSRARCRWHRHLAPLLGT